MTLLNRGYDKMNTIDKKYYVNVKELMVKQLPRPRLKPTVFVTGWGEWLQLVIV